MVYCSIVYEMNIKTKQSIIGKKQRVYNRQIRRSVRIFNYGPAYFGEPSKSQIESLPFEVYRIKTVRKDYRSFSFVRCKMAGIFVILVIRYGADGISRYSCQLMKKWDVKATFVFEK